MARRRLERRVQSLNDKGVVSQSTVKTYKVNKKKYSKDELQNDIIKNRKKAKENKHYKVILNQMKLEIKTSSTVEDVLNILITWQISKNDILRFFDVVAKHEKITQNNFNDVRFSDKGLKDKLNHISDLKSQYLSPDFCAPKNRGHGFWTIGILKKRLKDAGLGSLLNLSHRGTIWDTPLRDSDATEMLVKILSKNDVEKFQLALIALIKNWTLQLFPVAQSPREIGQNPNYKQTGHYFVALDCEWVSRRGSIKRGKSVVSERSLDDVLSFQLTCYNADTGDKNRLTVFNDTHEHFQFSELLHGILAGIAPIALVNDDGTIPYKSQITLLTMFGGVDASCFAGFETKLHDLMVLHKNFIFSSRYLSYSVRSDYLKASVSSNRSVAENEFLLSMRFVDVGLISPAGGLSVLGEAVGIAKINTEKWDVEDGYKRGFYKSHMDVLLKNRPDCYLRYAQLDADITLEYYLQAINLPFFKSWQTKPPATIGAYGASLVYDVLTKDKNARRELIFNDNLTAGDIANSKGVMGVKNGQAELFKMGINAFFGGFNLAFTSGVYKGRIIDTDLSSAYNVSGICLPIIDYANNQYLVLSDDNIASKWLNEPIHLTNNNDFKVIYELMKDNPFIAGVLECEVDLPDDIAMTTVPFQSSDKDYGPCYVKHGVTTIPLLDAFNAVRMGGTIKIIDGYVPAQSFNGLSAFGRVQSECLRNRNVSKQKKADAKRDGDAVGYHRYEVEQQLFKLTANSIYGKTGQGTSTSKRARDFDTNETDDINYTSITNPVIAGLYTSITRYLVTLLYESVASVCDDVTPLNITTDGYTFMIPENAEFDEDAVREVFLSQVPEIYKKRCAQVFNGVVNGFELKGNVVDEAFNVKTRVNGTVHFDDSNGGIQALASMRGFENQEIYNRLMNRQYQVVNKETRMSNITELKHHVKNHYGHQETWEQQKVVGIQYDFAYRPEKYISHGKNQYVTTLPFSTVEEHDKFKKLGMAMGRAFPIASSESNFQAFMDTMKCQNLSYRKTDFTSLNFRNFCVKNYIAMNSDRMTMPEIYKITDAENISRSTIRNFIKRHKSADENINYLAGWYFKNAQLFPSCKL